MKIKELKKIIREEVEDYLTDDRDKADFRKIRGHLRLMLLNYRRDLEKLEDIRAALLRRGEREEKMDKVIDLLPRLRRSLEKLIDEIEDYSTD